MTSCRPADAAPPRPVRRSIPEGARADHREGTAWLSPRCGRLVAAYEVRGIPALPGQVALCGRPAGHEGQCYSVAAWRRKLEANARNVLAARRRARAAGEGHDA